MCSVLSSPSGGGSFLSMDTACLSIDSMCALSLAQLAKRNSRAMANCASASFSVAMESRQPPQTARWPWCPRLRVTQQILGAILLLFQIEAERGKRPLGAVGHDNPLSFACARTQTEKGRGTERSRIESWAQPFPRTRMLRPSKDILRGPRGFRQPLTIRRQFRILGRGRRVQWASNLPVACTPVRETSHIRGQSTKPGTRVIITTV